MKFEIERLQRALLNPPSPPTDALDAAAVAIVLQASTQGVQVLLIRRAAHIDDPWSGHMAFPGGRRHASDDSLFTTAVRETQEEVGLNLRQLARPLGSLQAIPAIAGGERAGFHITPFVFELSAPAQLVLDPAEVAEALWTPLDPLCRGERQGTHTHTRRGARHELPAFQIGQHVVWGLTHHMLLSLLTLARSETP